MKNTRTLVISDIHGEYERLMSVLNKADYKPNKDKIVFIGDYIDRGPDSYKVVRYILQLKAKYKDNVVLLKGNHEDIACGYIKDYISQQLFFYNGGHKTLKSYSLANKSVYDFEQDIKYLGNLSLYYETDEFLFVHAGIREGMSIENQSEEDLLWIRDDFLFKGWQDYPKIIIHGHTPLSETVNVKEMHITRRLNIDTGAGKNGVLSLVDLTNEIVYQEKG